MSELRVVIREFGEDPMDAVENHLALEAQERPEVAGLAPTDVLIDVKSAAVGWVDLLMTSGQYQHMPAPPYVPGLEYAGEVLWVGSAVDPRRVAPGDRVMADGLLTGPRSGGAHQRWGGFARYAVAPERAVIRLPTGFGFDQGCSFLGSYETAYHCLIARGRLCAGETVLVVGASGATGLAAVHVARRVGARVIAAGRSAEKLRVVQEQGADHVVVGERLREEVKALTGGRGVDVVYDAVGGAASVESLRCVAFGARFLVVGWASTPFVARGKGKRGAPNANVLPTNLIMMKGLDVLGCPTVISTQQDPRIRKERLRWLLEGAEAGELVPLVGPAYPIEEAREALKAKWESRFVGGYVLRP